MSESKTPTAVDALQALKSRLYLHRLRGHVSANEDRNLLVRIEGDIEEWLNEHGVTRTPEYSQDADLSALAGEIVEPVAIKPLEWEPVEKWKRCSKERAPAFGGEYQIVMLDPDDDDPLPSLYFEIGLGAFMFRFEQGQDPMGLPGETCPRNFPSVEAAKAAAQADYERRIRPALASPPDTALAEARVEIERMGSIIAEAKAEIKRLGAVATDRRYMMMAYRQMLGPKGREVAAMWDAKGVLRQHTSWGPKADELTGEERAQIHLDVEEAPKTEHLPDAARSEPKP